MCGRNKSDLSRLCCQSVSLSVSCQIRDSPYLDSRRPESPAIKPPTFCLLLRAADRGPPRDDGSGAVKQLGVLRRFEAHSRSTSEDEQSALKLDVVGCFDGKGWYAEEQNTEQRGVRGEIRPDCPQ